MKKPTFILIGFILGLSFIALPLFAAPAAQLTKKYFDSVVNRINERLGRLEKKTEQRVSENRMETLPEFVSNAFIGVSIIYCFDQYDRVLSTGSGFLWSLDETIYVGTNDHVISGDHCSVRLLGKEYPLSINEGYEWNSITDFVMFRIKPSENPFFTFSDIPSCSPEMKIGSPAYIFGYPSFGSSEYDNMIYSTPMVTEGIISGHNRVLDINNLTIKKDLFPNPNYYVSNKIDLGNSGGMVVSVDNNKYCTLGVATAIHKGKTETQGIIQNISNIFYTQPMTKKNSDPVIIPLPGYRQ